MMIPDLRKSYGKKTSRRLSDLKEYFSDQEAVKQILSRNDPVIYDVYEQSVPHEGEHLILATTILHPGKVGDEFYFTKGHFHDQPDGAEVIIGITGEGLVLLQNRNGECESHTLKPFATVYSPPGYAHRAVNPSDAPFVFLSICRADIGHDYETIRKNGFTKRVWDRNGQTCIK